MSDAKINYLNLSPLHGLVFSSPACLGIHEHQSLLLQFVRDYLGSHWLRFSMEIIISLTFQTLSPCATC